jgi:hypothetical protein
MPTWALKITNPPSSNGEPPATSRFSLLSQS